ncbi:MAG: hypothetical protein EA347_09580 [Thioalkalivibrio sp.]|nr:MAG: hypothetical protein EA347_09580 [Thioalkalivibrio sp.]
MNQHDDDCIFVRATVLLDSGDGPPARVQTRRLCRSGVFVEYSGPVSGPSVEIVFPEPGSRTGGCRLFGTITRRWPDGVWIRFSHDLRSAAEMLMRNGPVRTPRTPVHPAHRHALL